MIKITEILKNERVVTLGLALAAAAALGMALIAQYVFGLAPCNLCVIQRYPFGFVIVIGLLGFIFAEKAPKATAIRMFFIGCAMLFNAGVAAYHTGVERKWWTSFLEGCTVPEMDPNDILGSLQRQDIVRCDEIPWQDPLLGLSMANYNIIFSLGLAVIAFIAMRLIWKKK